MFFKSKRLLEHEEGIVLLKELLQKDKNKVLVIHYSCESFVLNQAQTPRVTSIAVRFYSNGQTKSFSVHLQALLHNKIYFDLNSTDSDEMEKRMLDEFYKFAADHKYYKWVHWNMKSINYGFDAIANRYRILGGVPFEIDEDRRYDLTKILEKIYTLVYENHEPNGRLINLANRNKLTTKHNY